jgi:predicted dehydrogenase
MKDLIQIGLVGCGRLAEFGYLPAFRRAEGVKLAGVADTNPSRCQEIAPGVPAYDSIHTLIREEDLDALIICTPTRFHLADARCAAEARLPALLEKPPGLDGEQANALQALDPSPSIGFNRRFDPSISRLKEELPRKAVRLRLELHYRRAAWKPFDMHDDALLDLGPHLVDLARWLTESEILRVRAVSLRHRRAEFEMWLERAHATISCSTNSVYRECVEVKDWRGRMSGCYQLGGLFSGIRARLQPNRENPLVSLLSRQLEAFARAVRGNVEGTSLATAADGLAVMSAIDAVRHSSVQGAEYSLRVPQRAV